MLFFIALFVVCAPLFNVSATSLQYIDTNNTIKGKLAEAIQILNVDLETYRKPQSTLPTNHITHAYAFLKTFYQTDREFYRRGGKPLYIITDKQVEQILKLFRGQNATDAAQTPCIKKNADVVIFAGTEYSLKKRFHSFKKFLDEGFICNNVYFLSINKSLDACTKKAVQNQVELFKGIKQHFILADEVENQRRNMIKKIKPTISQEFYLISDPEYAINLNECCAQYGLEQGLTFLGTFVRPITTNVDEYIASDLAGYKFDEFIKDPQEQRRAAAYASLDVLAHQVHEELLFSQKPQ